MNAKNIYITFSLILFFSLTLIEVSEAQESCDDVNSVYQDALNYFNNNKGEQKIKQSLFGSIFYYDYKINLWKAKKIELTEAPDLGGNQLEYTYIETDNLADAEDVFSFILRHFNNCKPKGYIKREQDNGIYLSRALYIDERDKDSFMFYDWPEFEFVLSNVSGSYVVRLRILSKKFN